MAFPEHFYTAYALGENLQRQVSLLEPIQIRHHLK